MDAFSQDELIIHEFHPDMRFHSGEPDGISPRDDSIHNTPRILAPGTQSTGNAQVTGTGNTKIKRWRKRRTLVRARAALLSRRRPATEVVKEEPRRGKLVRAEVGLLWPAEALEIEETEVAGAAARMAWCAAAMAANSETAATELANSGGEMGRGILQSTCGD